MAATTTQDEGDRDVLEPVSESGRLAAWWLRLLIRRRVLVLVLALLLMVLAGMFGRGVGDKLTSGAYLESAYPAGVAEKS